MRHALFFPLVNSQFSGFQIYGAFFARDRVFLLRLRTYVRMYVRYILYISIFFKQFSTLVILSNVIFLTRL